MKNEKIKILRNELWPAYFFSDKGTEITLTKEDLQFCKDAFEMFEKAQKILDSKYDEAIDNLMKR